MATTKPKKIRALVGLRKLPEGMIKDLLAGSLKGLTENPGFSEAAHRIGGLPGCD